MANSTEILFEKFEIIEVLKKDEHAGVYLANHIYLHKKIILKVLNIVRIQDRTQIDRFKREAKILAQLDHPNIIKVLDFGTSKEFFYISFEYIEGMSLRNLLSTRELTYEQKESLMIQLLRGIDYSHNNKIIHRDIKPENILINEQMQLKIGDFGLALSAEDNFVTQPFAIVGTPSYMSPEQVRGVKLTQQSDLFSIGVVLFELFVGKNPFLKENINLTINEVMSFTDDGIAAQLNDLPEKIIPVLKKLLKKNVSARYNSAAEVLKDLNVSIEQVTTSIPAPAAKRSRTKALAPLLALPVLVLFIYFVFIQSSKPEANNLPGVTENIIPAQSAKDSSDGINNEKENKVQNGPSEIKKEETKPEKPVADNNENKPDGNNDSNTNPVFVPKYGELFIQVYPYATIFIDGQQTEETPLTSPIHLRTGSHSVKLVNPDYPVYSREVKVEDGQITNLNVRLDDEVGYLECKIFPYGKIYIDGEFKGDFPNPKQPLIRLLPGQHKVSVKNPFYSEIDTVLTFAKKDTISLKFDLKKH